MSRFKEESIFLTDICDGNSSESINCDKTKSLQYRQLGLTAMHACSQSKRYLETVYVDTSLFKITSIN